MAEWSSTKVTHGDVLRVIAHDSLPIAADGTCLPLPADFVMGIGGATRTLLDLTPSRPVERALDLGCGSGAQTVFLNAARIIATDIDDRALHAAEATCHLSGFRRVEPRVWRDGDRLIEFRQGSLLDPVAGQRFDLIVANLPFVIAGGGHVHRDSPEPGDDLTRHLLAQLPAHLNAGGRAVLLTSWLHPRQSDWRERLASWLPQEQVSAWVAQRDLLGIDDYVEVWGDDAGLTSEAREQWRQRLLALDADAIGFGWMVLERGTTHWVCIEEVAGATRSPNGVEVEDQLRAFATPPGALALLHDRWTFVDDHWRGPLAFEPFEGLLIERLRRGSTLADAVSEVAAAHPVHPDELLALGLVRLRALVEMGYFRAAVP